MWSSFTSPLIALVSKAFVKAVGVVVVVEPLLLKLKIAFVLEGVAVVDVNKVGIELPAIK